MRYQVREDIAPIRVRRPSQGPLPLLIQYPAIMLTSPEVTHVRCSLDNFPDDGFWVAPAPRNRHGNRAPSLCLYSADRDLGFLIFNGRKIRAGGKWCMLR